MLIMRDPSATTFGLPDSLIGGGASKPEGRSAKKSSNSGIGTSLVPLLSPLARSGSHPGSIESSVENYRSPRSISFPFEEFHPVAAVGAASGLSSSGSDLFPISAGPGHTNLNAFRSVKEVQKNEPFLRRSLTSVISSGNGASGLMKGRSFGNLRSSGIQLSSKDAASIRSKKKNFFHELKLEMNLLTTDLKLRGNSLYLSLSLTSCSLVAHDQDSNEMMNGKGIQLAYLHLETVQHADDNFGNRDPTTHYESFVASKITFRGAISALPSTRNPEFHRAWNMVERPHDFEELVGTPAWSSFLDCNFSELVRTGNNFSLGGNKELFIHADKDPFLEIFFLLDKPSSVIVQLPHMHVVQSLRSDQAFVPLGRYVATGLEPMLGRRLVPT
ncbi:hypothetical protein F2Q70_00029060 [Brassica cretica]|uniref:Uncharacterized protein n=1 Tax=Brassica cretica TaxID=69181 RepID=A0A8S9H1V8_BRACR|nr:hypothetical protein F2Q70_00029060 [Brassica cretica]KAF2550894.1 hypothetical protein F2Q68_00033489 [Brassica cretica]